MDTAPRPPLRKPEGGVEVEWTTITYRTILLYALIAALLLAFVSYLIAPQYVGQKLKQVVAGISAGMVNTNDKEGTPAKREAHFVNLDGTVRIKKASSLEWIGADYNTSLEKGDFVQTGGDGVARIIFSDGTNYVLKPDSMIVVEENREDPVTRATKVAVQVTSGAVDLSTGKFEVAGSTSEVAFADAVARLAEESRASVRHDPIKKVNDFVMNQGQAEVMRGATTVRLGQYDQVVFADNQPGLVRQKVIAPPDLLTPVNMALMVSKEPKNEAVDFSWNSSAGAVGYRLQVSPSAMFSNVVVDKRVSQSFVRISGLDEGIYYWVVGAIDAKGRESQPSMANRFNLVKQVNAGQQAFLEIARIALHGRVVEVVGRTEPGSTVIVNNEQVFSIAADGTFRHFTSPLTKTGANQITITAQNRKGDINTIRKSVVVE
jgi:hypothetical protein